MGEYYEPCPEEEESIHVSSLDLRNCTEKANLTIIWVHGDGEETIFNMANAMLLRIHQSGHLASLDEGRKRLVKEGIRVYKSIRGDIVNMVPFWPLGLADYEDTWVSMGLESEEKAYLIVWKRKEGSGEISLPLKKELCQGQKINVRCIYPAEEKTEYMYDPAEHVIKIKTDKKRMGRLFCIEKLK